MNFYFSTFSSHNFVQIIRFRLPTRYHQHDETRASRRNRYTEGDAVHRTMCATYYAEARNEGIVFV